MIKQHKSNKIILILLILTLASCNLNVLDSIQETESTEVFIPPISLPLPTSYESTSAPIFTITPESTTITKIENTLSPTITQTPRPTEVTQPKTVYYLNLQVDYAAHHIIVKEQIDYINSSTDNLLTLSLMVEPRRYPGVFDLISLTWADGTSITQHTWRNNQLILLLPDPLQPGEKITFHLSYQLTLPKTSQYSNTRPRPFGYTDKQVNLGDWYPFIPPYQPGQGWMAHEPGNYGEYLVYDIADYEIDLEFTGDVQSLSVAASSIPKKIGSKLRFEHKNARSFALSVSPHFEVAEENVLNSDGSIIQVFSYYFPLDEKAGKRVLQTTKEALQVYSQIFGPYQHQTMTAVQADFLDGMEFDGLYFLSKDYYNWHNGTSSDLLVTIAAHETAHQWWYAQVGNDQALEPWLDEALCTYSEHLFFEHIYPDSLDWWWTYRVNYYQPHGYIDINIYSTNQDTYSYFNDYRNVVYLNGASFLEDLRVKIGDDAFFVFLKDYREKFRFKQVTKKDFFELLRKHTDKNIDDLLSQYFYKN